MLKPGRLVLLLCAAFLINQRVSSATDFFIQGQSVPPGDSAGIDSFNRGDDESAIKTLRGVVKNDKANVRAWHYLGLALERQGKIGDARKAHERAAKLGDVEVQAVFEKMGISDNTRLVQQIHEVLVWAMASAQKYVALGPKSSPAKQQEWNERLEELRSFEELFDEKNSATGQRQIFSANEVTTKVHVLSKPEPTYTEEARKDQVTGTVILRAIFSSDGKLRAIRSLKTLPDGLTQRAISAARQIRFTPALRDGKPVSVFMQLEYYFNLY